MESKPVANALPAEDLLAFTLATAANHVFNSNLDAYLTHEDFCDLS